MATATQPKYTVSVTWLDGEEETFICHDWRCEDGQLTLLAADATSVIPLISVRIWELETG